jgi:prepilin-type N-terminal cleavage/methylation domain-containing protein
MRGYRWRSLPGNNLDHNTWRLPLNIVPLRNSAAAFRSAFTLIELLVVIAIIASVLFSLTNSAAMWNNDHQPHPETWWVY